MEIYLYADTSDEKKVAYQHEKAQKLLLHALEKYDISAQDIVENWRTGRHGKPYFASDQLPCFSLSHTEGFIVCAISNHPIGIDVEKIGKARTGIIRRFHQKEQQYIMEAADMDDAFYRIWTLKEAYLKMTGDGLTVPLSDICLLPGDISSHVNIRQMKILQYIITVCEKI